MVTVMAELRQEKELRGDGSVQNVGKIARGIAFAR